jgi:hypothetical protein
MTVRLERLDALMLRQAGHVVVNAVELERRQAVERRRPAT